MADNDTTPNAPAAPGGDAPPEPASASQADLTGVESDLLATWHTAVARGGMAPDEFNSTFQAANGGAASPADYLSYVRSLPEPAPANTPSASAAARETPEPSAIDNPEDDEPTLYTYDENLLAAHALLGSLVHAPAAHDELEKFLEARDFANADLRAVYLTVRGLWTNGELVDVVAMQTPAERLEAASRNQLRVMQALQTNRFTSITVLNIPGLLADLAAAAPPEAVPFRGVYDPRAQIRLGRMVLEDSIRRRVGTLGVSLRTRAPQVDLRDLPRQQRPPIGVRSNLLTVANDLEAMSERLTRAADRTGPAEISGDAALQLAAQSVARRRPPRPGLISTIRLHRAERDLIHLALHSGPDGGVLNLGIEPQDFTHPRHVNTWHAIQRVQQRGEPVNAVSVFYEVRTLATRPVLSDRQLMRMTYPPPNTNRIARSLRAMVNSALTRSAAAGRRALETLAANRTVPVEGVLAQAKEEVVALAERATTAGGQHRMITNEQVGRSTTR
jgi:hypothetical protein